MFTPESFISSVQSTKRVFVNQYVSNATIKKACLAYIDAQETFSQTLVKNTFDITTHVVETVSQYLFPKQEKVSKAKVTVVSKEEATA